MKRFILFLFSMFVGFATPAQTQIGQHAGPYHELFEGLKTLLVESKYVKNIKLGGQSRRQFVPWIRDHIHVMKAMKYLDQDVYSFWEFFMQTQTSEGLYFDYYFPIEATVSHRMNLFDPRYWHIYVQEGIQMHRLPIEADLEYLMVEGAHYIWQASGNRNSLDQWLPYLEKGMHYAMSDPLRWSSEYQLVKRGYTLDTWDFMQLPMSRNEYVRAGYDVQNGIFNINEDTPMGIMHGDNSGMYAACHQLAGLFRAMGDSVKAADWDHQAEQFRLRTNSVCWNGSYYAHFVPVDSMPSYLHIDQKNTLSLSNPYDINRGLPTQGMTASIIQTYQGLKDDNDLNSFAEWFGIYPPVRPHFADYEPGSYMNGGVNTIVAGELAKAALQHGFEQYGVDILNRILALMRQHQGDLPVAYRPDGSVDEGIPDNWGQAAVMSALIEGLAGVVDQSSLFEHVEISPRWLATEVDQVEVTVEYPSSQKKVQYTYQHHKRKKQFTVNLDGDMSTSTLRLLIPADHGPLTVSINEKPMQDFSIEKVEQSTYLVIRDISSVQPVQASISY